MSFVDVGGGGDNRHQCDRGVGTEPLRGLLAFRAGLPGPGTTSTPTHFLFARSMVLIGFLNFLIRG